MSDVLQDWILQAVEKSLLAALQWKSGNHQPSHEDLSYCKDGSLAVHFKEGKYVQLIQVSLTNITLLSTYCPQLNCIHSPYNVLLSDSHTQIRADIKEDATDSFRRKHERPFSERTLGGVLFISDFDLVRISILSYQYRDYKTNNPFRFSTQTPTLPAG
jgi:hypothetical protein